MAYTDDDVSVDAQWIDGVVRGFRRRADVACVTGLVCSASVNSSVEAYFDARASSWSTRCRQEIFDLHGDKRVGLLYPYEPGIFGTGANFAFDRAFLEVSYGFDEALGAGTKARGGEDLDKFVNTLLCGRAIAYEPSAVVWHHHRADRKGLLRQMFGYGTGLSAFITKNLVQSSTRWQVLRRVPQGIGKAARIRPATTRALGQGARPPRGATFMEVVGYLAGPFLYMRARQECRRRKSSGVPKSG